MWTLYIASIIFQLYKFIKSKFDINIYWENYKRKEWSALGILLFFQTVITGLLILYYLP